jgi:hypothetical protein
MAKDKYHFAVKIALEKLGWTITHDPLLLIEGEVSVQIDLGAEQLITAERDNQKIAVEIKTFGGDSNISQFHTALGQYLNYLELLEQKEPNRELLLAIPEDTYLEFFEIAFVRRIRKKYNLELLVYDPSNEVIIQWKPVN